MAKQKPDREAVARNNVEAAVTAFGKDWIVEVKRLLDGYTLLLSNGERSFERRSIDERVLEDEWSDTRDRLIEQAHRVLDEGRSGAR